MSIFVEEKFRNDKSARNSHRFARRARKLRIWQRIKGESSSHATLFSTPDGVQRGVTTNTREVFLATRRGRPSLRFEHGDS